MYDAFLKNQNTPDVPNTSDPNADAIDSQRQTEINEELAALYDELLSRKHESVRRRARIFAWKLTIHGSYLLKRILDIVIASLALVLLAPFLLLIAILIRLDSTGPVIFTQIRVGKDGRFFRFYKFRSMYKNAEERKKAYLAYNESKGGVIFKMKRDPRITRVGRILRKTSLDELPQFWNVLKGDMSLVGPRPPLPAEVALYTLEDRKRLNVIPGLTCLWQISGRSDIPFQEQVRLDKEYILHHGLWNDLKILIKTPLAILSGRGAY